MSKILLIRKQCHKEARLRKYELISNTTTSLENLPPVELSIHSATAEFFFHNLLKQITFMHDGDFARWKMRGPLQAQIHTPKRTDKNAQAKKIRGWGKRDIFGNTHHCYCPITLRLNNLVYWSRNKAQGGGRKTFRETLPKNNFFFIFFTSLSVVGY